MEFNDIFFPEKDEGVSHQIEDVIVHPDYNRHAYHDVSVIQLKPSQSKLCQEHCTLLFLIVVKDILVISNHLTFLKESRYFLV